MADKSASEAGQDISSLNFEQALEALENIVRRLEAGNVGLEESIDIYTRGNLLRKHCEAKLATAQARIEKITLNQAGEVSTAPLEVE